ncbi:PucR family transcriptional regulator [Salipaludibacillus neizhouensis]|uniref:PucR family transcriptional regulator n=1 Tax=Salipaludibacillus neizhouensis TaxID=885475 RepID=A0A3A9KEZ3_9BACI|nr:helix-turn-helix domain-containing protein [Salipaludibacillus neizhouensis]RKL66105.1 PucR family transcriptional regulator [Salipaludibacillus neizhouensis]
MKDSNLNKSPFAGSFESLESLVDKISDVLQCPATIEDTNHRLLAYSSHDERTDAARIATIMGRRVPEKVINSLWRDGVMPKLVQSEDPVRISEITEVGLGDRIAITIRTKNEILGYIWVLEIDNHLSEEELRLLKEAAKVAKNHLLKLQGNNRRREKNYQEFFWQLLTGHLKSQEEIKSGFEELNIYAHFPISVMVFQFSTEISTNIERYILYMITTTEKIRVTFHVINHNELILLCSPAKGDLEASKFIEEFIAHMNQRFTSSHIQGSCGNIYETYEKVEASYQEALTVLRLKKQFSEELKQADCYQNLGVYRYLDLLIKKNEKDGYENNSLQKLTDYDEINNTNLLGTLEVFINKDSHVNEAAKELHIHTNTLAYRLKRIAAVGKINLRSPNEKMTLYVDMKLNKMKKRGRL